MTGKTKNEQYYTTEVQVGEIFSGSAGEMQKDTQGNFWHKSHFDGRITKINPAPHSQWVFVKMTGEE